MRKEAGAFPPLLTWITGFSEHKSYRVYKPLINTHSEKSFVKLVIKQSLLRKTTLAWWPDKGMYSQSWQAHNWTFSKNNIFALPFIFPGKFISNVPLYFFKEAKNSSFSQQMTQLFESMIFLKKNVIPFLLNEISFASVLSWRGQNLPGTQAGGHPFKKCHCWN